jgi:hypothetical protein
VSHAVGNVLQEWLELQGTLSHFSFVNSYLVFRHSTNETGKLRETRAFRSLKELEEDEACTISTAEMLLKEDPEEADDEHEKDMEAGVGVVLFGPFSTTAGDDDEEGSEEDSPNEHDGDNGGEDMR